MVTIGNFDGHHRGHRALLDQVVTTARREAGTAMVLTFDPHPVKILAPHVNLMFLTLSEEKLARFEAAGIDEVVFRNLPCVWLRWIRCSLRYTLRDGIGTRELFVGEHFCLEKAEPDVADLFEFGAQFGFRVHPMPPVTIDETIVSSHGSAR